MTSQCTAQLLADLGVTRSLSRPQVSDDNPFSEAQFKTLKYHPSFPGRFGDQGQAKTFCRSFFRWYNAEHRHGGISMLTPEQGPLRKRPIRSLPAGNPWLREAMGRSSRTASSEVCRSPNRSRRPSSSILPSLPSPHRTLLSN